MKEHNILQFATTRINVEGNMPSEAKRNILMIFLFLSINELKMSLINISGN